MADWTNSDGLEIRFNGPEAGQTGASVDTCGGVKEVILDIADMSAAITAAADGHEAFIPAGSFIVEAFLKVTSAMTGTTGTLTIGLAQKDGTVIDADGIDATIAQADLAANKAVVCDGALVGGTATIGSADGYLYTSLGGTVTGGAAKLVVRYI